MMDKTLAQHVIPLNIIVAGPYRSGTTRLYNIVRFCISECYGENYIKYKWINEEKDYKFEITRCHFFHEELISWKNLVFTTKRDLRDLMSSCWEFFEKKENTHNLEWVDKMCKVHIKNYKNWKEHSDYELEFKNFDINSHKVINDISSLLKCDVSIGKVIDRLENQKKRILFDKNLYTVDPTCLEIKNHIQNKDKKPFYERLEKIYIDHIEKNYSEYCF